MAIARLPILMLLPAAMLAGALAAQAPPQQQAPAAQAASHSATVTLTGAQQWVASNITVAQGDRLVLRARGAQISDRVTLDPDGIPDGNYERLLPEAPPVAVIGRIGGGDPFLVGAAYDGPAPASGMLELGINFVARQDMSGRGQALFEVTVEHMPQTPPAESQPEATNTVDGAATNTVDDPATNLLEDQGNGVAETPGNEAAGAPPAGLLPRPDGEEGGGGWLVPLLIGAAGAVALLLVGRLLKNALRPKPLPTLTVGVHPSLDRGEGGVSGDEIALAGPEVRLRTRLEPGATIFAGGEPVIEREERDG